VIRSLAECLDNTAKNVSMLWAGAPKLPIGQQRKDSHSDSLLFPNSPTMAPAFSPTGSESRWQLERTSPIDEQSVSLPDRGVALREDSSGSPSSDGTRQATTYDASNPLLVRGKGQHRCPHGSQCTKGGFRNGEVIVFERNSAFRLVDITSPICVPSLRKHQLFSLQVTDAKMGNKGAHAEA
jgi:hypothetical protein